MSVRRLLSVGHSYAVGLNRRLTHEMARAGVGRWEVTVAAPAFVRGDLRPIRLEPFPGEAGRVVPVGLYLSAAPHVMAYGPGLRSVIRAGWDIVHVWEEPYLVAGFQACRAVPARTPVVFWTAQNLSKWYPPPFGWFERYCVGRAAGWLAAGATVRDNLLSRPGYAARPHRVMPLGVDLDAFRPDASAGAAVRRRLGWDAGGPPVVGYLGRFVPEKGLRVLTRALDAVRPPWRALFVGGGPLEGELRAWAAARGDRVRVVTGVPHDAVPAHLNAMDVLAAPSQTTCRWKEQLGRMLIEAFAAGVPVIGSDSGEIPHVLADAGVVVPEADAAAWAAAVGELVDSPARRADLAARGRARAAAEFAWPVIARRHLDFFGTILDAPRPPS